jgi:hypothetical protein
MSHTYQCPLDCTYHRGSPLDQLTAPEQAAAKVALAEAMNLYGSDIRQLITAAMQAQDQAGWRPASEAADQFIERSAREAVVVIGGLVSHARKYLWYEDGAGDLFDQVFEAIGKLASALPENAETGDD